MVQILDLLLYKVEQIDVGIKYLGYNLKPNNYLVKDWKWLIRNIE